ncbi:MAG: bifunctional DNA-binding transcriptional regulator/O6-methylguanine-DNA methyltransferase Ada [Alphaproteobacteria bacterium]|nr:bifunctional DNA-binding transcriptional regulator/O6-methylguanine-DNA methyltransferase Ada [Alphaproteobacteria bacterium]
MSAMPAAATPSQLSFDHEEARWDAVVAKQADADGVFVYAVATTGIYCRPSCSSRQPARRNVSFFETRTQAEKAGFRACRKCGGQPKGADDPQLVAVRRACMEIESAEEQAPSLDALAQATGVSPHHLHRTFKKAMGITPHQYWDSIRLARLKENLRSGESVAPALYSAGYGSSSRLYEKPDGQLGMTPASYGKGGAGAVIAHTLRHSTLGLVLVGTTAKGVCFVALGDDEMTLMAGLEQDFPRARLHRDDEGLGEMLDRVVAHLEGREPRVRLPLDVQATAFQRQVWQALSDIPYGETRSYAELAAAIGNPGASRAVGRACGSNPVALLVPCHRAIGADGRLTGYRWGLERKQALLAQEQAATSKDH